MTGAETISVAILEGLVKASPPELQQLLDQLFHGHCIYLYDSS